MICMSGEIEDESHFVVDCAFYDDLREKFKNVLMKEGDRIWGRKEDRGRQEAADATTSRNRTTQGANKEAAAKLRQETLNFWLCDGGEPSFCGWTKEFEKSSLALFVVVNL